MTAVIAQSIILSEHEDRTVTIDAGEASIDDIILIAHAMGNEIDYCDLGDHYDVWGWTDGITEEDEHDWRLAVYKS